MKKLWIKLAALVKKRLQESVIAKIALGISVVVVFSTTYALVLPALTISTGNSSSVIQSVDSSEETTEETITEASEEETSQVESSETSDSSVATATSETETETSDSDSVAAGSLSAETSDVTVTVTYEDDTFSEPVTLKVSSVSDTSAINNKLTSILSETKQTLAQTYSYDISFVTASGEEVEPSKDVNVSITFKGAVSSFERQSGWKLYHFVDNDVNKVEDLTEQTDTTINQDSSDSVTSVDFKSDSFSNYTIAGVTYPDFSQYLTSGTYTTTPTYSETTQILTTDISLSFYISNKATLEANSTYALELPDDAAWPSNLEGTTKTEKDKTLNVDAYQYKFVQENGKKYLVITFLDSYIEQVGSIVGGTLEYTASISSTYRDSEGNYEIKYTDGVTVPIESKDITVISDEDDYDVSSSKTGSVEYDGDQAYLVYTVTVSSNKGTNGDITFSDTLSGDGLGDITIDSITIDSITKSDGSSVTPSKEDGSDKKSFTMTLSQLEAGESYTIKYRYKVSNFPAGKAYAINNTVNLESPDIDNPGNSNSWVTIERNKITKTGEYDSDKNTITWTIKVNENKNDIAGATLSDEMFSDAIGDITISPSTGIEKTSDGYKFTAVSDGKNTNTYEITYKTDAGDSPNSWAQSKNQVTNTVELTDNGETSTAAATVGTGEGDTGGLEKTLEDSEAGEDASTKILTWKSVISMPSDGTIPAETEFTDTLMAGNNDDWDSHYYTKDQIDDIYQTLVSILGEGNFEFSIWESGQTWQDTSYDQISSDKTYGQFKFKLLSDYTGDDITLEYKSTIKTSNGLVYHNTISSGDFSASDKYLYQEDSKVTKMDADSMSWNQVSGSDFQSEDTSQTISSDGKLSWAIKVKLDDDTTTVTITDKPKTPSVLTLTAFTLGSAYNTLINSTDFYTITDTSITGTIPSWSSYKDIAFSGTIDSEGTITMTFTDTDGTLKEALGSDYLYVKFTFQYSGELPLDDNIKLDLTNEASATLNGNPAGKDEHIKEVTVTPSQKVSKTGKWLDSDDEKATSGSGVYYTLTLNPDAQDLNPDSDTYTLTDTLTYAVDDLNNLSYNLVGTSVKLLDSSGNEVTDGWSWKVEKVQEGVTVKSILTVVVPDEQKYTLQYVYSVSGTVVESTEITNTASIEGLKTGSDTDTEEVFNSSGTAYTDRPFKITKVDAANYGKVLKGAIFNVYEYGTDTLVASYTTGDDGTFNIYKNLSGATDKKLDSLAEDTLYYVKEVTAPSGYDLSDDVYYFYYSRSSSLPSNLGSEFSGDTTKIVNLATTSDPVYVEDEELPPTIDLTVNKKWFTADGDETSRSDGSITYDVIQVATAEDGTSTESTYLSGETLSHDDDWTKTYTELPVSGTDSSGNTVTYTYYVKENAVSGYDTSYTNSNNDVPTEEAADMAIASDSATITIRNTAQKQYDLPETGGNGTQWHYLAGATLSLLAIGFLIFKVYKRYQIGGHL